MANTPWEENDVMPDSDEFATDSDDILDISLLDEDEPEELDVYEADGDDEEIDVALYAVDDDGEDDFESVIMAEDLAQITDVQRRTEMNQQRIAEVISKTVKLTPETTPKQPPPPDVQNRRQHNRIQASILVNYESSDDDGDSCQGMGVVLDISISGLQLQTPRGMAGERIKIFATDFNDVIMEINGTVRQSRQKGAVYLNGISFDSSESETIKFITNLVRMFNARKYGKVAP